MGINLGKIGFMTEIEIDDMEDAISKFLQDDFTIEKRMMMKAEIRKENKIQFSFHALNDVVVSKVAGEKLIYMELSTDGVAVNRYTADGLIIATPTGSMLGMMFLPKSLEELGSASSSMRYWRSFFQENT